MKLARNRKPLGHFIEMYQVSRSGNGLFVAAAFEINPDNEIFCSEIPVCKCIHCLCTSVAKPSMSVHILRWCNVFGFCCWSLVGFHGFLEIEFSWWIILFVVDYFFLLKTFFPDFFGFKGEKLK